MSMQQPQTPSIALRIPPQPVPNIWELEVDPDAGIVAIFVHGPSSINYFIMDADNLAKLADQFAQAARQAKSGLVIPGKLIV